MNIVKREMKKYFDQLIEVWENFNDSYPKMQWNEEATSTIYDGDIDEEGYVCWKPIEKNIIHDFEDIERELEITLHSSIKDYFNSYWFGELAGFYKSYNIILEPVLPGIEINDFVIQLIGYKESHKGKLDNIPLGIEGVNGFLVVVENETGIVKLEEFETGKYEFLSESIESMVSDIKLKEM